MREALEFAQPRTIKKVVGWSSSRVIFTDNTAIEASSVWSGPLSEVTPDIDADPPEWGICEKYREDD